MGFSVVIPARYASTRLPGKPLREISGRPMIQWVWQAASQSGAQEVVIATDDERIVAAATGFSADVCMTASTHQTGTDRIVEVITTKGWSDDQVVVNLQGDEPLMPAENIRQVADNLQRSGCDMATLHKVIDADQAQKSSQVKLVLNHASQALYFSRSQIPYDQNRVAPEIFGHIGLYAYRAGFVRQFAQLPPCALEQTESLEQLRALYYGHSIHSEQAAKPVGPGVDTEADLLRVTELLREHS